MKYLSALLFVCIIFLSCLAKGQSELDIKTTGKYIYSWAIERNQSDARKSARLGLLDTIYVSLLQQATIDQTDTIFIKEINYFEKKVGFKWQVIAFAEKSKVNNKVEQQKKIKTIPVIIGDASKPTNTDNKSSLTTEASITNTISSDAVNAEKTNKSFNTGNAILDELLILPDAKSLRTQLERLRMELKLNYGYKQNYPDDSGCYIFVIEEETKHVIAVYDKGTGARKDFLSQDTDNNYSDKYKGSDFVYVVIN